MTSASPKDKPSTVVPTKPIERLDKIIQTVVSVAEAKGWSAELNSIDEKRHEFASIYVSKQVSRDEIEAEFEIENINGLKFGMNKLSFYGHGLNTLKDSIWEKLILLPWLKEPDSKKSPSINKFDGRPLLIRMFRRLHRGIRQLKHRHNGRDPLVMNDEYDLQDFVHAMLRMIFDDVRAEEYAPSYGGGSSRMDFLLKKEKIVVETKFTRPSLRDKQVGEELIVDIERYRGHPDCQTLICLVYDPLSELKNPAGLENDLTKKTGDFEVEVIIVSPS